MPHIDAFVLAVPRDHRHAYIARSRGAWDRIFAPAGALRMTEIRGDDLPEGEVTSFPTAVKRKPGEMVVLGRISGPASRPATPATPRWRKAALPRGWSRCRSMGSA